MLAEILSPEKQLAAKLPSDLIPTPNSAVDQVTYLYQSVLDNIQISNGVPWWGVVIGTAFVLRLSTLPFQVQFEKGVMGRIDLMRLEREGVLDAMKGKLVASYKKLEEVATYRKENKVSSSLWLARFLVPGCTLFLLNYSAIHGLASINYAPLLTSSFLWLPSLCISDPLRLLSFANGALVALIASKLLQRLPIASDLLIKRFYWISFTCGAVYLQASLPAAMVLFWTASNATFLLLSDPLLRFDPFRTMCGLVKYSDKLKAFNSIPRAAKTTSVQLSQVSEAAVVDTETMRARELTKLWDEGDVSEFKESVTKQLAEKTDMLNSLQDDLKYCQDSVKDLTVLGKISDPGEFQKNQEMITEKKIIEDKMISTQQDILRLTLSQEKAGLAERKASSRALSGKEAEEQCGVLLEALQSTHSDLLKELDWCEGQLENLKSSKDIQHFQLFIERNKLIERQSQILDDVDYCEREIFSLSEVSS